MTSVTLGQWCVMRSDIGDTHVATATTGYHALLCPRLNQSLKKRSMVSRPLPEPIPQDQRPVQVIDEDGELSTLAKGDIVDPERESGRGFCARGAPA